MSTRQKPRVLVVYYSAFGYVAVLAGAIADGVRDAGGEPTLRRIPEIVAAAGSTGRLFAPLADVPAATVEELATYDAIIVGSPTRFGRLSAPVAAFLELAGDPAAPGALRGKVGGAFTSPTGGEGGQESASLSILTNLLHLGMIIVGPPFSAATLADASGQRYPSGVDLQHARQLGQQICEAARRLQPL